MDCGNDGGDTLSNCRSNPNIRIEKRREKNKIKHYKLSLHSQNMWWTPNDKWFECRDLCKACKRLPGENENSKSIQLVIWIYVLIMSPAIILFYDHIGCGNLCEEKVDRFLNSFCANVTPTTLTSTVTDTQTTTSTSIKTETVVSVIPTTVARYTTIRNVQQTVIVSTIATTTTEMVTITPTIPTTTIVSTTIVTVSPICTPKLINEHRFCQTTTTTTVYPSCIQSGPEKTVTKLTQPNRVGVSKPEINSETTMKSNAQLVPTIALGSLIGVFLIVLAAVIIGWVWTCWSKKKKGATDISSNYT